MQLEDPERVARDKPDGFRAEAHPKPRLVFDADCQACPPVSEVDAVKSDLPDQGTGLDDPAIVVVEQSLQPSSCLCLREWTQVGKIAAIHAMYFGINTKPKARRKVVLAGPAESDALAGWVIRICSSAEG